jgi:hypothetical protein
MLISLLCEDRLQEQFLEGLCKERGYWIVRRDVAPSGEGSGADWVIQRFSRRVLEHRAFGREQRGLLVALDGDNQGCARRLARLDEMLREKGLTPRAEDERISILVPTWSIETWVLFLHDGTEIPEDEKSKEHRGLARLTARKWRTLKRDASLAVTTAWFNGQDSAKLPSLSEGRREARRLKLA